MFSLGVDQSLSGTGIALIDFTPKKIKIHAMETVRSKNFGAERLIDIRKKVAAYLEDTMLQCVVRENYAFAARGRATFSIGEVGGVLDVLMHERNFVRDNNYYIVHNTSWRKFLIGQGRLHKDTQYLMTMYKKLGVEFKDDNQSDAYCLAVFGGYVHSIRKNEMKFSDLTEGQQMCLLDAKRLLKEKKTTQVKAVKELSEEEKRSYMLSF